MQWRRPVKKGRPGFCCHLWAGHYNVIVKGIKSALVVGTLMSFFTLRGRCRSAKNTGACSRGIIYVASKINPHLVLLLIMLSFGIGRLIKKCTATAQPHKCDKEPFSAELIDVLVCSCQVHKSNLNISGWLGRWHFQASHSYTAIYIVHSRQDINYQTLYQAN